jgi:hypothetical protein
MTFSP